MSGAAHSDAGVYDELVAELKRYVSSEAEARDVAITAEAAEVRETQARAEGVAAQSATRKRWRLPRLGDTPKAWHERLQPFGIGRSLIADGRETFSYKGMPIIVQFEQNRAVAIRGPYPLYRLHRLFLPTQPAGGQSAAVVRPRILLFDSGWIVATEQCGLPLLRRLAGL